MSESEYMKGQIEGLERMCSALFAVAASRMPSLASDVELRIIVSNEIRVIINDFVVTHATFVGTPFGKGFLDAITEFRSKLLS